MSTLLSMNLAAVLFILSAFAAAPAPAAQRSPHDAYDALNALRIDPAAVYRISPDNHIELRRGDAKISFDEGALAFFLPFDNHVTGAIFVGRGHILALPRDTVEKQQLARFLGAPVLDQEFASAYLRFTDSSEADLVAQFQSAKIVSQSDPAIAARWDDILARLNPSHSLRIYAESLVATPRPYFYANLDGAASGPFDVLLDSLREEPFLLGQSRKSTAAVGYDVWASYRPPSVDASPPPAFHATHYSIEATIQPDHTIDATAAIDLRADTAGDRFLTFSLSRALAVDKITGPDNQPLDFFQNQGLTPQERSARGNDFLNVVLPRGPQPNATFTLHFHYRGNIINDAGNDVLFVGARESWYPHLGDSADFALYNLTMRWPRKLRLVATGSKIDERDDGDFRVGHWQTEKPVAVAGFNLGEYASASVFSSNYTIDVYANRQLEQEISQRLRAANEEELSAAANANRHVPGAISTFIPLPPNPAAALAQLGKQIDSSIHFYETYSGPFPFRNLSVSQIPGTFGQGWPGLLYVSTYSFLSTDVLRRAGLSSTGQEHFSDIVPYHEVAHQWWGNVVGWSSYRDQWIDEAIANYLALLFADSRKNPDHTLRVWLQRYRQVLIEKPQDADEPAGDVGALSLGVRLDSSKSPAAYQDLIYGKGAWVIHMLREMLRQPGPDPYARFNKLLRTLIDKYSYRALSTQDLRREVEAVMTPSMDLEGGHSMEWFFEEWVQGTGIPHYRVEYSARKSETGYALRGKLFQENVPQSFIARVPLYTTGPGGRPVLLGTVVAAGPETAFHFNATAAPRKLLIDPQMTLLCTTE